MVDLAKSIAMASIDADGMSHLDYDAPSLGSVDGAHEIGHLLGIWGHLDDPSALMYFAIDDGSRSATAADLAALAEVWGE